MKITVGEAAKETKYPRLMKSINTDTIILALGEDEERYTGFVINDNSSLISFGQCSNIWHKNCFEPFNGTVTLQND